MMYANYSELTGNVNK